MSDSARRRSLLGLLLAALTALGLVVAGTSTATARPEPPSLGPAGFGSNVLIFDPSMPQGDIQASLDAVAPLPALRGPLER